MTRPRSILPGLALGAALLLVLAVVAGCLHYHPVPPWVTPPRAEAPAR